MKNTYMNYLDWPTIPNDIIPSVQSIIDKPMRDRGKYNNIFFHPKSINDNVSNWIMNNICPILASEIKMIQYQVIYPNLPIHIDSGSRRVGLNYLLQSGGKNAETKIYNVDREEIISSTNINPFIWHYIITEMPHTVSNIEDVRVGISIVLTKKGEDIFFEQINYSPRE